MTKAAQLAQYGNVSPSWRNRIINGAMKIAQRGTSFSFATGAGALYYGADRFRTQDYTWSAGTNPTVSNDTSVFPTGFSNSYKWANGATPLTFASGGFQSITQAIEGSNIYDCYTGSVTLSFWVRSSTAGTYSVWFTNSYSSSEIYIVKTYTINSANTWEQKSITIDLSAGVAFGGTWNKTNGEGLSISFMLGGYSNRTGNTALDTWTNGATSGVYQWQTSSSVQLATIANSTFYVTGVQLEKGSTATSFDYRPYGTELALCQRYYEKSFDIDTAPANGPNATSTITSNGEAGGAVSNNLAFGGKVTYAVSKRVVPTITAFGNSSGYWWYISPTSTSGGVTWSASTQIFAKQGTSGFAFSQNVLGNTLLIVGGHWTASAEL